MNILESRFNNEMRNIYLEAKKDLGYNAARFIQLVTEIGGVKAAKQLISVEGVTYGFEVLWEHKRLDLSIEAHVIKPEYNDLFTDDEREICRNRLIEFGFLEE